MKRGFTVIEVLIYLALSGIMLSSGLYFLSTWYLSLHTSLDGIMQYVQVLGAQESLMRDVHTVQSCNLVHDQSIFLSQKTAQYVTYYQWFFKKGRLIRSERKGHQVPVQSVVLSGIKQGSFNLCKHGERVTGVECCIEGNQLYKSFYALRGGVSL